MRQNAGSDMMKELTQSFMSGNSDEVVDIIEFATAPWGLGFKPTPVQKFMLRVFYGLPLEDKQKIIQIPDVTNDYIIAELTEVEFLNWLYEEKRCNTKDVVGKKFTELDLVLGRRAGKSTLAACISNYELYKLIKRSDPSQFYGLLPDANISITNVAPTDEQAGVVFEMIQSMAMRCPFLRDRSINQTQTYFNLMTDTDYKAHGRKKRASITCIAGGCASNSLRGRANIVVIMDEFAFFIDNGGRFSGQEVFKALTPSTANFKGDGRIVCISSPYAKYGAFWDRYNASFQEKDNTLMFKMYTSLVNPAINSATLKAERRRNKVSFICEYGGEFSDSVVAWIEDEKDFRDCISKRTPMSTGVTGITYYMGIDLGLKNDGTAICIVHRDEKTKKIILDYAVVYYPKESDVWEIEGGIYKNVTDCKRHAGEEIIRIEGIANEIKELCKRWPIKAGFFDQWNGYSLMEQLHKIGLKQFEMEHVTERMNSDIYQLVKMLYLDKFLDIYDHPVLVPELLSLEAEKRAKNRIIVRAPNKIGSHDDISDAFSRAVWTTYNAYQGKSNNITSLVGGNAGTVVSAIGNSQNMSMFQFNKLKTHGTHARLGFSFGRNKLSGVR